MEFPGPGRCWQVFTVDSSSLDVSRGFSARIPFCESCTLSPHTGLLEKPPVVKNQNFWVCERKRKGTIISSFFQSAEDGWF